MKHRTKHIVIVVALAGMLALAGCAGDGPGANSDSADNGAEELEETNQQNFDGVTVGSSYEYEVKMTEKNHMGLVKKQPPFQMDSSLERENLIRRYQYLNDENNVHHVYAYTETGQIIGYWVAQGKVSSVNSKLTNDKQIVAIDKCLYEHEYEQKNDMDGRDIHTEDEANCFKTVESPQMDGSYGTNGNAIFFFTTDGKYVEYNGKYVVSEEPMNIQSQVVLTQELEEDDEEGNSTDG